MITRRLILLAPEAPAKAAGAPPVAVAAPAPAAPSPAPAAAPTAKPDDIAGSPDNPFDDATLDAKFSAAGTDIADPKAAGGDGKPTAAANPTSPKPAEKPAAVAAPTEPNRTPKELRAEKDRLQGELATEKAAKTALEAKIAAFEKAGKDTEALKARLEQRDAEFEKLQGELRMLKQEASPEFKAKFDKPFDQAARYAENLLKGITKEDGASADFDKDFVPLYRMPYNAAFEKAKELFGESASVVMAQVGELQRLDFVRREAMDEEKKGWAEKSKAEEGLKVQQREQFNDALKRVNSDLENSVPHYQVPVDDNELGDARKKGLDIYDAEPKTPREAIWKGAHVRYRAAMFGPNQLMISRLKAQLAAKDAEIATLKPGQPNPDPKTPATKDAGAPEKTWEQGAREAMQV